MERSVDLSMKLPEISTHLTVEKRKINEKSGAIEALVLPKSKLNALFMQQEDYSEIAWDKIVKIGTDTILVKL